MGLGTASICACRSRKVGNLFDAPDAISLISAPAMNIPREPARTTPSTAGSDAASLSASASPSRTWMLVALTGGLSISTAATLPSTRYLTAGTRTLRIRCYRLHAMICESLHCVSMETVDAVVIGAGVVGLAVARALAARRPETVDPGARGGLRTGART